MPPSPRVDTCTSSVFFIVYKGAQCLDLDDTPAEVTFPWALGLGIASGLLTIPTIAPHIRRIIDERYYEDGTPKRKVGLAVRYPVIPETPLWKALFSSA